MGSFAREQFELLTRMASLDSAPCIMGGYAEDALTAGTVTRPHEDIDWILPRQDLELRMEQARELGFREFETWGESAPGEPFYLFTQNGEQRLDLGIADEKHGLPVINIYRLTFEVDGHEAPAGYRVYLPDDTFDAVPVRIDGVPIWTASPLALYQLRIGIASRGSFGKLSEKQRSSLRRLKETFFAERSDPELEPRIEYLD